MIGYKMAFGSRVDQKHGAKPRPIISKITMPKNDCHAPGITSIGASICISFSQ